MASNENKGTVLITGAALAGLTRASSPSSRHGPTPPLGERRERLMSRVGTPIDIINTTPPTISWQSSGGRTGTATLSKAPIIASNALIYPIDNPILLVLPPDLG